MVRKLYKKFGSLKVYLSDIEGSYCTLKELVIGEREKDRELLILKGLREYNLRCNGQRDLDCSELIEKCRKNPLLIPHWIEREWAKIRRREKVSS